MASNSESALQRDAPFKCFNVNCYALFKTERGLKQHLWRSDDCGKYMSEHWALIRFIDDDGDETHLVF